MLRQCVKSLLDQTYPDIRIIVVVDGGPRAMLPRDSRIDVVHVGKNRGAYFCRAVALAATSSKYHAVVDSDDWVEPDWLDTMMSTMGDTGAVQHGSRLEAMQGRSPRAAKWVRARQEPSSIFTHFTSHTGVYETQRIINAGGYSPNYRTSYDSLLNGILRLQGEVAICDRALYHRRIHSESLTQRPETRLRSDYRERVRQRLREAWDLAWKYRDIPGSSKAVALSLTPDTMWSEVRHWANKVK
nr:glycosyl transferase family 2 [uncultured bacterium]AMP54297.1 glycosyl transferase family 2 [uncultured bacterium]AMP54373.1 glycosyl transferase family 2 [uncultured bacterium]AMP54412.1 glycosyl transferase family 2 [uncultured bacterium]